MTLHQRSLQPDPIRTPCWNGPYGRDGSATRRVKRDVDELMAAAVEAIEGDVTDYDMCMDLTQTIQEVFNHAIFQ